MDITLFGQSVEWLELTAMLTGIAGVWLTIRQHVWCFPVGIVNVGLYAILFFTPGVRLYADAMLQCIYVVLLGYGWMQWTRKKTGKALRQPERTSLNLWWILILIVSVSTLIMGWFFGTFTHASLPFMDSFLTSVSLVGQWMIARKKMENWLLWIFADAIYIPMYLAKQLPLTAILYLIFLIMAWRGWITWKRSGVQPAVQS